MDYTTYYIGNAYLCKKFECLLIVYRRTNREFINVVKINPMSVKEYREYMKERKREAKGSKQK